MTTFIQNRIQTQELIRSFAQIDEWFDRPAPLTEKLVLREFSDLDHRIGFLLTLSSVDIKLTGLPQDEILNEKQIKDLSLRLPIEAKCNDDPAFLRDQLREKLLLLMIRLEDECTEGRQRTMLFPQQVNLTLQHLNQLVNFEVCQCLNRLSLAFESNE